MKELEPYIESGILDALDLSLARMLLNNELDKQLAHTTFICHLSRSFRSGNLCVDISDNSLFPTAELIWKNEEIDSLPQGFEEMIILGSNLPETIMHIDPPKNAPLDKPIVRVGNRIYFLRAYLSIQRFINSLHAYLLAEKRALNTLDKALKVIHEAPLQDKQKEACLLALSSGITLIMGGPGTGKTYTAAHIVKAFQAQHIEGFKIALAAPTGKAASNLKAALSKVVSMDGIDEPKTLHALLRLPFKSKTIKTPYRLEADLFIVDEASMIDMDLMSALLRSMKPSSKLILLGDPNQLPPIDLGAPFSDLAESKHILPLGLSAIELETCMRCESAEVLELSQKILEGDQDALAAFFKTPKSSVELVQINASNKLAIQKELVDLSLKKYAPMIESGFDAELLFSHQKAFSILTPFRIGVFGSEAINQAIVKRIYESSVSKTRALPIMVRENRADLGLYNGDLGFLVLDEEKRVGLFKSAEGYRTIPELLLPAFEYAFCLSIHKSQGSEFQEALILIPEGSEGFGKKILYTALTRVKKKALIYSKIELLCKMASHTRNKESAVAEML